ncbi:transcription factor S [Halanaeroarchaeum sulfurireducens]|uniref:Transcription factor S n=1 Tax=Halanaeroarchaeum sulfurireducens TaxID=1604004 RepID=A0A0F7PD26_9EURY|nr:transcription factor S [Halanaeroarchaeum sulfurireducens]AKH97223.1 transcription termination factor Tfs [Halanaeroarchaeum sulfurireducens]ALG81625.1 transcription termination factor Tfs [Halanaeroarchaeum sulfurireducens]
MEFCDECGSMMRAEDGVWVCANCDNTQVKDPDEEFVVSEEQEVSEIIESDEGETGLPTTDARCPECGNDTAYWYLQQIRAADESETRFFVCTECEHKWREDDH